MTRQIRAVLIALHLVAITLAAVPIRQVELRPGAVQGVAEWGEALANPLLDANATTQLLTDAATGIAAARRAVIAPFRPYYRYAGAHQAWMMFASPATTSHRFEVHIRTDTRAYQPLFIDHSAHRWRGEVLDHARVRTVRDQHAHLQWRRSYRYLVAWIAREVAAERPDATTVRVRLMEVELGPPARIRAAGGLIETEPVWVEVVDLAALR